MIWPSRNCHRDSYTLLIQMHTSGDKLQNNKKNKPLVFLVFVKMSVGMPFSKNTSDRTSREFSL